MIEGLPQDASPSELHECIMNDTIASEFTSINVRLSSSNGSRRAFVQFQNMDYAARFVRHHYPEVRLDSLQGVGDSAGPPRGHYIHYARSREEEKDSWECAKCRFSNYGTRTRCKNCGTPQPSGSEWKQNFTGATDAADAAQAPSQILVVYPLGSFINENTLAEELKRLEIEKPAATRDTTAGAPKLKSTAPTGDTTGLGARQGSLHRVFLMRDVQSHESFKYGFVEFWTLDDAQAALSKFHKSKVFTVSGCVVNVAMIHMGVFLPEEREQHPGQQHMSFVPLFNPSLRVRYRDMRLYPSERMISPIPPSTLDMSRKVNDEAEKKAKKRKAESASGAGAAKKKAAPGGMMGQMAMWQRKHEELHVPGEDLGPHKSGRPERPQISDTNSVPVRANPNAPIRFNIGQQKPGAPPPPSDPAPTPPPLAEPATSAEGEGSKRAESSSAEEQPLSFVDRDRLMCLICMRKYKSTDEVDQHERSRNHKTATENEELVEKAKPRLAARDKRIAKEKQENPTDEDAGDKPQYRDRAKERRQANNQPKAAPSQKPQQQQQQQRRQSPAEKEQPAAPAKPVAPSKGAGMLAKMGWTSGSGLGANGEGRKEVVPTEAYQEGVGLGAEGGKLGDAAEVAERRTKGGYAEYVSSVQDRARERYSQL
ncbi:hypothetical protein N3K66_000612 [Trichothecium roseum]|uniref:Uncharacterized protein n=1 Tax=Trichothecium roseum TaxID=47278 RepID=A0ACC0VE94_9HYPO|nr:hypothetical protein N3K66_000612 [Trichothecium roseum]